MKKWCHQGNNNSLQISRSYCDSLVQHVSLGLLGKADFSKEAHQMYPVGLDCYSVKRKVWKSNLGMLSKINKAMSVGFISSSLSLLFTKVSFHQLPS